MKVVYLVLMVAFCGYGFAQASSNYEKALLEYNDGDIEASYIHLKNALQEDNDHLPSKILMGKVLYLQGFARAAITELEEALQAGADPNLIISTLAKSYLYVDDTNEVFSIDDASLNEANALDLLLVKATTSIAINDERSADKYYEEALLRFGDNNRVLQSVFYHYIFTGQEQKALTLIEKLTQLAPNDYKTVYAQGVLANSYNDLGLAIEKFEQANFMSVSDPLVQRSLANAYIKAGRHDDARTVVKQIVENTPDDPFALVLLAKLDEKIDGNLPTGVLDKINQQLSLLPDEIKADLAELSFVQALATYLNGQYEQAAQQFESYLSQRKTDVNAISLLADTYIAMDQEFQALNLLDKNRTLFRNDLNLNLKLCNLYMRSPRASKCDLLLKEIDDEFGRDEPNILFAQIRSLEVRNENEQALRIFNRNFGNQSAKLFVLFHVNLLQQIGDYEKALERLATFLSENPDDMDGLLKKAEILIASGEPVSAGIIIDQILATQPKLANALELKALSMLSLRKFEEAEKIAEALYSANRDSVAYALLLSQAFLAQAKPEPAKEVLDRAAGLTVDNRFVSELLVQTYKQLGDLDGAIKELNALLRNHFLAPVYLEEQARLLIQTGKVDKAISQLNILYGLWSKQPEKLVRLSRLQVEASDFDGAMKTLVELEKQQEYTFLAKLEQLKLLMRKQDFESAESLATNLRRDWGRNPIVQLLSGELARKNNDYETAHRFYLEAYKLDDTYLLALTKLYQLAIENDVETEQFITLAKLHLEKYPNNIVTRNLVGDIAMLMQDYASAREQYEFIAKIESYPNRAAVLNNLALIAFKSDSNLALAKQLVSEASDLGGDQANILDTMGYLEIQANEPASALKLLRQAYSLDSNNPQIQYHLALALKMLERHTEAKNLLTEAVQSKDRFLDRDKAQKALDDLM
ncbi:tetratricopeptide repeat protein [Ningiella sp. W23]|uniref:tetratricopeptide repeat protein n=1 Tax=Ningiella sp. W23 TaxID=3023715 RepID=UPI0037570ECE